MKTPEEMAEEYTKDWWGNLPEAEGMRKSARQNFLAGYQAAKDTYREAISAYEDVAKQMLEEALRIMSPKDELADADKVIAEDSCEHILHMEQMVDVNSSSGWIRVKNRLPEDNLEVLFFSQVYDGYFVGYKADEESYIDPEGNGLSVSNIHKYYTHWMPLPAAPKGEK